MTGPERAVSSARSALRALLAGEALVGDDVGDAFAGAGELLGEAALARRVREQGAAVVVAREPSPTLLRALRERPPALLVITGPELPAGFTSRTLGPAAQLAIEAGELVIVGPDAAALTGLRAAFAAAGMKPRLSLSPAPAWLPEWLAAPELAGCRVAGMVPAASLHAGWARWARSAGARQVVVPLGVEAPRVDTPRHPSLGQAAAAHALERLTGPVFPSPGVLALLLDAESMSPRTGPSGHVAESMSEESAAAALWRQARRALPLQGDDQGMEAPHPGLSRGGPANATTDAFLAQRALLRRERAESLVRAAADEVAPSIDPAALGRAEEVLRSAGQALSEHESKVVLRGFGIEVTRQAVAGSASGAAQFAEQIGFPVVLKAVSPDLRRKQELGAVVLDLTTSAAVRRAYATVVANVEERAPTAHLDGVLVAEQIGEGLEIHCGAVALQSGETALFGRALAGHQEVVLRLSPLDPAEAMLFAQAIVAGVPLRRKDDPGLRELAGLLLRLDALVRHFGAASADSEGRLELVDLSPVRLCAGPRGYVTLDARIVQRAHLEGL
ncbi:acetate--CoA ligase family protein [Nannocystis punicea]|uniref:Acetate--CoA ligase family protein n=1 Tax=Nannocystis punicea TaxID=2995304 RepID=A0ABY7HJZ0_9BACT|nr:acetate--CoA ligase family protein [Nannocystis poenicansa]WAS99607.1 acetate--CoA ligase family protein [Nannocystis poenicansa]